MPALFDLGIYPAAIPCTDTRVWGEVHRMLDIDAVLTTLDEIEGFSATRPDASLYRRAEIPVTFSDGHVASAWVWLYNAPLGRAERIPVWRLPRAPSRPGEPAPGRSFPRSSFSFISARRAFLMASTNAAITANTRSEGSTNWIPERYLTSSWSTSPILQW